MNSLYCVTFLYFIVRDTGTKSEPVITTGFMRQTNYPWRTGRGLQLRIGKYVVQFGVCKKNKKLGSAEVMSGLLHAVQGRLLTEEPKDIGNW
jgi:hypothetical protein